MKRFSLFFIILTALFLGSRAEEISKFSRNIIIDELTGTWCKWCPFGIVYIDEAMEQYGDRFIPIIVHGGTDIMKDKTYCKAVEDLGGFISYPNAILNRDKSLKGQPKPDKLLANIPSLLEKEAPAHLSLSTKFLNDSTEVELDAKVDFSSMASRNGWKLSYVVLEDSVHQPGDLRYRQQNGYAGGDSGEMGGFESMDNLIDADLMYYRYVCRGSVGDFNGLEDSLPVEIEPGETYFHTTTFTLPENVIEKSNTYIVALLLNDKNQVDQALRIRIGLTSEDYVEKPSTETPSEDTLVDSIDMENTLTTRYFGIDGVERLYPRHGMNIVVSSDGTTHKIFVKE